MKEAESTAKRPVLKLTTLPVMLGDGVVVVPWFGGTMAEELNGIAVQSLGMHVSGSQKNCTLRTVEGLETRRYVVKDGDAVGDPFGHGAKRYGASW